MELPSDVLSLSPEEAARRISLSLLEAARAAAARLDDPADEEALHDFRVALRRLRSTLRSWRPELGDAVPRGARRRLRRIQNATGAGRDAEVALAWLAAQRPELSPSERIGHDWVAARLEARREEALSHAREGLRPDFERVRAELQSGLEVMTLEVHLARQHPGRSFAAVLAGKARDAVQEVVSGLAAISSPEDRETAHRARIAGKRLRYLIEPVRSRVPGASAVVSTLKQLQDLLGELHDAHLLRDELGTAVEMASAEHARTLFRLALQGDEAALRRATRRSPRAGILALARRVEARIRALAAEIEGSFLEGGGGATLLESVEALAQRLEEHARGGVEIERKYLLRGRPELDPRAEVLEVEQGWLPGERVRERLRRVRGADGEHFVRTLKLGHGVERSEIEEPLSRELFQRLWPLTEGCRIRKRRYRIQDAGRLWEIDEFLDVPLWLAEVELDDAREQPKLPAWLAPFVVREVSDDPRFTNLSLASDGLPRD